MYGMYLSVAGWHFLEPCKDWVHVPGGVVQEDAGKVLLGDAWGTSRVLIEVQQSQEKFVDEPSFKQDVVRVCVCLIHACVCVCMCVSVCVLCMCVCACVCSMCSVCVCVSVLGYVCVRVCVCMSVGMCVYTCM